MTALGLLVVLVATTSCPACAEPAAPGRCGIDPSLVLVSSLDARDDLLSLDSGQGGASEDRHDPARMFLFSLAVPGSGQLVQGQKRWFVYLAAEAAFWTGFFILNGDGLDKRDAYEDFADEGAWITGDSAAILFDHTVCGSSLNFVTGVNVLITL